MKQVLKLSVAAQFAVALAFALFIIGEGINEEPFYFFLWRDALLHIGGGVVLSLFFV